MLLLGMYSTAHAVLLHEFTYPLPNDAPETSYRKALRHFDHFTPETFFNCIPRVSGQASGTITRGDFTITFNQDKSATISWSLTDTDHFFLGVYVAGGPHGGRLYENIPEMEGDEFKGTAQVHATKRRNGIFAAISHIDFFCGRNEPVPDEARTLPLLGGALAGLLLMNSAVRRQYGKLQSRGGG